MKEEKINSHKKKFEYIIFSLESYHKEIKLNFKIANQMDRIFRGYKSKRRE